MRIRIKTRNSKKVFLYYFVMLICLFTSSYQGIGLNIGNTYRLILFAVILIIFASPYIYELKKIKAISAWLLLLLAILVISCIINSDLGIKVEQFYIILFASVSYSTIGAGKQNIEQRDLTLWIKISYWIITVQLLVVYLQNYSNTIYLKSRVIIPVG